MATIACVTSVTPDDITVTNRDNTIRIEIDQLAVWLAGNTTDEQLTHLHNIAQKLWIAHDRIAAQQRLHLGEA